MLSLAVPESTIFVKVLLGARQCSDQNPELEELGNRLRKPIDHDASIRCPRGYQPQQLRFVNSTDHPQNLKRYPRLNASARSGTALFLELAIDSTWRNRSRKRRYDAGGHVPRPTIRTTQVSVIDIPDLIRRHGSTTR